MLIARRCAARRSVLDSNSCFCLPVHGSHALQMRRRAAITCLVKKAAAHKQRRLLQQHTLNVCCVAAAACTGALQGGCVGLRIAVAGARYLQAWSGKATAPKARMPRV